MCQNNVARGGMNLTMYLKILPSTRPNLPSHRLNRLKNWKPPVKYMKVNEQFWCVRDGTGWNDNTIPLQHITIIYRVLNNYWLSLISDKQLDEIYPLSKGYTWWAVIWIHSGNNEINYVFSSYIDWIGKKDGMISYQSFFETSCDIFGFLTVSGGT